MQPHPLAVVQSAIRQFVCERCFQRPAAAPINSAADALPCQPDCELFTQLPRLAQLVNRFGGEPPCGGESVVWSLIHESATKPSDNTDCPLSRYAGETLAVLERFLRQHRHASA